MQPGRLVGGRFELCAIVGSGGNGSVWSARDATNGETVALKVLHHIIGVREVAQEAELLATIRHPHVVRYIAHGIEDDVRWLAMEWLEGEDLAARLERGPLGVEASLSLAARVAEALAAAHARGVVHRDIKPGNLFLVGGDVARVRLVDFGVALGEGARAALRTGVVAGTPGYMAPEQARGRRDVHAPADVFALGCVLFECITGRAAFRAEHPMAVLAKVLVDDPPRLRELVADVPQPVDDLVARMLAKDPAARPRDGDALGRALSALPAVRSSVPPRAPDRAIGDAELRLVSVVLVGPPLTASPTAPTLDVGADETLLVRLRAAVAALGADVEALADGSVIATIWASGAATDQARVAARTALALRVEMPEQPVGLATGRALAGERLPAGEAIDRAAALVAGARPGAVAIDDVTAALLDERFAVGRTSAGLSLLAEITEPSATGQRTLLGRPTPFLGRDLELRRLLGVYDACVDDGSAFALLVTGPPGAGKSRLRDEVLKRLVLRPAPPRVWLARADALRADAPFALLAPALRAAIGAHGGDRPARVRERIAAHLAGQGGAPRAAEFAAELLDVADEPSEALRAARGDPPLMADQLRLALVDAIAASSARGPLVIVVDDLQWADEPSVRVLQDALRRLADAPLFVLTFARPEVSRRFPDPWGERGGGQMALPPLPRRAAEAIAAHALGPKADPDLVARLGERAAGNAFWLEELVRAAADGRTDELPPTVLALAQARLEALEASARRVLRAASVLGPAFWRGAVRALLGDAGEGELDAWLDELVVREFLVRRRESRFAADVELAFRHGLLRDAAYATLTDGDRALAHRLAARWLEGAGEKDAAVVARHLELGGDLAAAAGAYRDAAQQALDGNALEAVVASADRGLALGAKGRVRAELAATEAVALRWMGKNAEAARVGEIALDDAPPGSPTWCSAVVEITVASVKLGDPERAVAAATSLRDAPGADPVSLARVAIQLLYIGRTTLSDELLARLAAIDPAAPGADQAVVARVMQARAMRSLFSGDLDEHVRQMKISATAFERTGDRRNACASRANMAFVELELGAPRAAAEASQAALADADGLGLKSLAALARCNLSLAALRMGDAAGAQAHAGAAIAAFVEQGDRRGEGASRINLSLACAAVGDLEGAEREAALAAEQLTAAPASRAYALGALADARLRRGDREGAVRASEEAIALLEAAGSAEEGASTVRLAHVEALAAAGRHDEARTALGVARARLLARAGRIVDEARRRDLLEAVPPNARTLALAAEWLGP